MGWPTERAARCGRRTLVAPRDRGESVQDLIFVGLVLVFFGVSFGYAAFCDRL